MKICNINSCNIEAYENEDKCVLHCKKNEYSEDWRRSAFLDSSYDQVIEHVAKKITEQTYRKISSNEE